MKMRFAVVTGLSALAAAIVLGIGMAAFASGSANAQEGGRFTESSISGTWGFSALGTVLPPIPDAPFPAAAMGIMEFRRNGQCSITDTVNFGGTAVTRSSTSCTFTVNADGTGTLTAEFPGDPGPTPLSFVIVDNKKELQFIRTDLGVARGVAKRQ